MSTEVRFYHLERQSLDQALPALVAKAYSMRHRIVIQAASDMEAEQINGQLWTHNPDSFIPHGTKKDGHAEKQPVWITSNDENPNDADVLILTGGGACETISTYKLCCDMFNGRDEDAVKAARSRWKAYKDAGFEITYWQQGANGWEKKSG